ncbi:hypothetical protein M378DRAFT_18339 [Amanita muscaria Koide BX008]|uniref:Uncharacterized protein n=1 Tax=Amanita muscaria (strain Koide BX008) TaxID=946122 RepID=A0A0C2SM56_AMAMK|nr:hypothetical protein M378DRAFT_18339 [Amanita muscaria Koide BX008]
MYHPLNFSFKMIDNIKNACLEDDIRDPDILEALHNPPSEEVHLNGITKLSITLFMALITYPQEAYDKVRGALEGHEIPLILDSYYIVKKKIERNTGVTKIETDMCCNSCVAFTGPVTIAAGTPPYFSLFTSISPLLPSLGLLLSLLGLTALRHSLLLLSPLL